MQVDIVQVEELAKYRLSIGEICDYLDYDETQFREEMALNIKIKQAFNRGRAIAVYDAASVVIDTQNGSFTDRDKQDLKMKAALAFLDRHSPGWRQAK